MENATIAADILISLMVGVEEAGGGDSSDPAPIKFSEVSQICREFHMSPQDLRDLSYADFINLVRGFNAASGNKFAPPSEDEFAAILAKYEPEKPDG